MWSRRPRARLCPYARALFCCDDATLDDRREAVATLEEVEGIARRVFGSAHPMTKEIGDHLRLTRAAPRARS